jgi:hypothetical protein
MKRGARLLGWGLLLAGMTTLLVACSNLSGRYLSDQAAQATATVCGCFPYGSYPHDTPSATPTPTGTWVPPTRTPTPTKTRPPANCDYCTMAPQPTATVPFWPPPAITCTPRPDEPTLVPPTAVVPPLFPTLPPATPLPPLIGNTAPAIVSNLDGDSLPGGIAADPRSGQPYFVWTQLDPDLPDSPTNSVYLYQPPAAPDGASSIRSVQGPGTYRVSHTNAESAIGIAPDGTIYVAYTRSENAEKVALLEERHSTDGGQTWSAPYTFPYTSDPPAPTLGAINNVRLVIDAQGQPHIAAIAKTDASDDPQMTTGVIDYYERQPDGTWLAQEHPVSGRGGRQFYLDLTTLPLNDGTIRTVLGWNEDQVVYTSSKDGSAGTWSAPQLIIDGNANPYGIPDYWPGYAGTMRFLTFSYQGAPWVYFFWSLYSTGRIAYIYSSDGGQSWSAEDALAYFPIFDVPPPPTPVQPPVVWGSAHWPAPFWDAEHQRIFTIYQYCSKDRARPGCFPVYSYSQPGGQGQSWVRYADPAQEPVRLFQTTLAGNSGTLRSTPAPLAGSGVIWLLWNERLSSREIYFAGVSPATLLSGNHRP